MTLTVAHLDWRPTVMKINKIQEPNLFHLLCMPEILFTKFKHFQLLPRKCWTPK